MPGATKKVSKPRSYRTVGTTYDGVKVLAPKVKSKKFTEAQVKKAIETVLASRDARSSKAAPPQEATRIRPRDDGRYEVKRPGKKKASAVTATQAEAIERAAQIDPDATVKVKRVRKSSGGKRGTYRKP